MSRNTRTHPSCVNERCGWPLKSARTTVRVGHLHRHRETVRDVTETLRTGRRDQVDHGTRSVSQRRACSLEALERENRDLRRANEILKDARFLRDRARRSNEEVVRYIDSRRTDGSRAICKACSSPRTYYAIASSESLELVVTMP